MAGNPHNRHVNRVRGIVAFIVASAMCSAPAPAVHIHADHDANHHAAPVVHSHVGVHVDHGTPLSTLGDHDAAAVYLDTAAAVPGGTHIPAPPLTLMGGAPATTRIHSTIFRLDVAIASFHDPPHSTPGFRAPPLLA